MISSDKPNRRESKWIVSQLDNVTSPWPSNKIINDLDLENGLYV